MYDICIASIPYIPYNLPPAAPATLKGHLNHCGFTVLTRELNLEAKVLANDPRFLQRLTGYWVDPEGKLSDDDQKRYAVLLQKLADHLFEHKATWVGLSVFSPDSQNFCRDFLPYIQNRGSKILLGGLGLDVVFLSEVEHLIDCYIQGDGELALENLLKGNMDYPGINSPGQQIMDLDQLYTPDYSDYFRLNEYDSYYDSAAVQLTSSKGCIRDCTFCTVGSIWAKYRYRSGEKTANDILTLHRQTGVRHFFFTDSLINGNLKELMKTMEILAEHNRTHDVKITWGGQWISRKQQGLPKNYYQLIKESGGFNLTIGVETGSDTVREHMRKGFTNEDLDAEMEQFSRHGITCAFFLLFGYPTETRKDFTETLDMIKRYTKYVADGTIVGVILGAGFNMDTGMPLYKEKGVIWDLEDDNKWLWRSLVSNADYVEKIYRRIVAQQVVDNFSWPVNNSVYELSGFLARIKEMAKKREDSDLQNEQFKVAESYTLPTEPEDTNLVLRLTGTRGPTDWPMIDIFVNGILLKRAEVQGEQEIEVNIPFKRKRNILKITLTNKSPNDTVVDEHGNITHDKKIVFNDIVFGEVRIRKDDLYMRGFVENQNGERSKGGGLFQPQESYKFYFENPTLPFFLKRSRGFYENYNERNKELVLELIEFYRSM